MELISKTSLKTSPIWRQLISSRRRSHLQISLISGYLSDLDISHRKNSIISKYALSQDFSQDICHRKTSDILQFYQAGNFSVARRLSTHVFSRLKISVVLKPLPSQYFSLLSTILISVLLSSQYFLISLLLSSQYFSHLNTSLMSILLQSQYFSHLSTILIERHHSYTIM